jgi:hypothetical protein
MAAEPELLAREGSRRRPMARTATVALLIVATVIAAIRSGSQPSVTLRVRALDSTGNLRVRTVSVAGVSALRLAVDVQTLTPGRISCGSPGPADVVIRFRGTSYDVNGECARVVRLPEQPGETVWLESAALHDDLSAALG